MTKVGKRGNTPPNDIEIGGMGIRPIHAVFTYKEDKIYLQPI